MERPIESSKDEQTYVNILPLEGPILGLPEVTQATASVKNTFYELSAMFGFQLGNVKNQEEHLILLFANSLSRFPNDDPNERQIMVCDKLMENYNEWCSYVKEPSEYDKRTKYEEKVGLVALYLCIWGEAANVRFLPECICFIFHLMAQVFPIKDEKYNWKSGEFLRNIIKPIYDDLAKEKGYLNPASPFHSKWRNYDDFNEYYWRSSRIKEITLQIAANVDENNEIVSPRQGNNRKVVKNYKIVFPRQGHKKKKSFGKTHFVEHRTFLHLYHSFARFWILFVMMFQCLALLAYNSTSNFSMESVKLFLSLGSTYFLMKFVESILDIILLHGAYRRSPSTATLHKFLHFLFYGGCAGSVIYLYVEMMLEESSSLFYFNINLIVLGSYVSLSLIISILLHPLFCRRFCAGYDGFQFVQKLKWWHQDQYFVGCRMFENFSSYISYAFFWVILLVCKFTFSYFFQIKPLMDATPTIASYDSTDITYVWHDFISKHNHNALTIFFLWAPIILIYFVDIIMWYAVFSAIVGGILGAKDHLGEIRTLDLLRRRFKSFPKQFEKQLQHENTSAHIDDYLQDQNAAKKFAPYWNKIIDLLRKEDYLNNREVELLTMPEAEPGQYYYFWHPLFLLAGKVSIAAGLASDSQWDKVKDDPYMNASVNEVLVTGRALIVKMVSSKPTFECKCFFSGKPTEPGKFVAVVNHLKKLIEALFSEKNPDENHLLLEAVSLLFESWKEKNPDENHLLLEAVKCVHESLHAFASIDISQCPQIVSVQRPPELKRFLLDSKDTEINSHAAANKRIKRLQLLLTVEAVSNIPKNVEAQRRLQFFTNSLFMGIPSAPSVRMMRSFSVLTPYYNEPVLFSKDTLCKENEDGITILFYLKKVFPDEWSNLLERIKLVDAGVTKILEDNYDKQNTIEDNDKRQKIMEVRLWASYRGQTLARTVRGIMYYKSALTMQSESDTKDTESGSSANQGLYADLKFTYVVTCQNYGKQRAENQQEAEDIHFLLQKYEYLRVAYVHEDNSNGERKYFSKLVKGDPGDPNKEQTIYSIELPGNPILGEGKPENQNHAVIFTRGDALQTIDMNQDNYFEEALKMRNLLEEFSNDSQEKRTILGVREHVFTGSVSSLAWFMSNQETSFVTLGQRVLARPLKVRMHYGHPDVFDRLFHITRGGFSKASKVINVSEDIYAGFNSTLRGGNITHHEYIQVGKGRDVGLNQIALFEAKVSSGNGEQSLSRDVYRLGRLLDFFRMLSFFVTSVGYYFCTMMMLLAVYIFLYGKAYLALSGVEVVFEDLAKESENKALQSSLDAQFLFQIGTFTAIPMLVVFILEQGILKACVHFVTMQLQLCSVFFTFSLGTRAHYFGRTILHGGAKYRQTGRGFVVKHITFAENYRLYSRSHFVKALEIILLLIVYLVYGYKKATVSYVILSFSSWFLAISWLFAPFIFNPSGFEWQKIVDDFDDWTKWLSGVMGVKENESWAIWWEEQEPIGSLWGRILETVFNMRFLFFQYGVIYHLDVVKSTSLGVYGASWLIFLLVVTIIKIYSFTPKNAKNRMPLRLFRFLLFIVIVAGLVAVVGFTDVTTSDIFASLLALVPTGWGLLCICVAWKPFILRLHMWKFVTSVAHFYDAAMGAVIFFPVAVLSWFPFVSTFQTRLLFNQAFSRGLEISLILAGRNKRSISAKM